MQRFDLFVDSHEEEADKTETPVQNSDADGEPDVDILSPAQKREATYDDDDDAVAAGEHEPPSKKRRQSSMESDAALAARLQAEENLTRRRTRGAGSKKPTPKKKTKKVKSAAKMKTADGAEGDEAPKKNTGFHVSSRGVRCFDTANCLYSSTYLCRDLWAYHLPFQPSSMVQKL